MQVEGINVLSSQSFAINGKHLLRHYVGAEET
jgi:hypothetical protein